jgi:methylmalonyl-CoA mutase cobalamin-binding subunit
VAAVAASEEEGAVTKGETRPSAPAPCRVLILPVRADRDEIAGAMLTQLLLLQGFAAENLTAERTTGELLEVAAQQDTDALCISVMRPSTVIHAQYLCGKLRQRFAKKRIVVAMWGLDDEASDIKDRLRGSGADDVISTLSEGLALFDRVAAVQATLQSAEISERLNGEHGEHAR